MIGIECSMCNASFSWFESLTDHLREVHGVNIIQPTYNPLEQELHHG